MSNRVASSRQASPGSPEVSQTQFGVPGLVKSGFVKFKKDTSGDIAMMFGFMAIIMMVFIGGAVDFGRWLHASRQTRSAVDAAVLAGARVLQVEGSGAGAASNAIAAAQKYYTENTRSRIPVENDTISFVASNNNTSFTATGNAYVATPILKLLSLRGGPDIQRLPVFKSANADYAVAKLAAGGNAHNSIEIAMMLDTSGSMSGTKISDMKSAAKDLVDIVVWDNQGTYTSKVSIAPFSADVRLPTSMNAAARGPNPAASVTVPSTQTCSSGYGSGRTYFPCPDVTYALTPCVVERKGTDKYNDNAPGANNYVQPEYDNGGCSQPSANVVVPLSNNKTALKASIDGLVIGGGTAGHLGTAWAWYTISPNWASVFPASSQPQGYNTPDLKKIAILMTDGEYNTQYSIYGVDTRSNPSGPVANDGSVAQALALCTGMKAQNIDVYTVGFDLGGNQTAIDTLSDCASSPENFYNAADGAELRQSFRDIALKISSLYLSK